MFLRCVKPLVFVTFLIFTHTLAASAADVTFNWLPNTETSLAGYKIHCGTASKAYTKTVDVGLPATSSNRVSGTMSSLAQGTTYYFAATAYDNQGNESGYSDEVVYTVASTPIQIPVATDSQVTGNEDSVIAGSLSYENAGGLPVSFAVKTQPGHGTLSIQDTTGNYTYTPVTNYNGTDNFTFAVSNTNGISAPATVSVTVQAVNDAPTAQDSSIAVNTNELKSGQLSGADIDSTGLTYHLVTAATKGTATVSSTGAFTYKANTIGGSDSFTFAVNDGHVDSAPATVSVSITAVNVAPVAKAMSITTEEDTTKSGQLSGNDADGNALTYHLVSPASKGAVLVTSAGGFTYSPNSNVNGSDSFSFAVNDGHVDSAPATVSVTISPVNDPPAAQGGSISVTKDTPFSGKLVASDPDQDKLTYQIVSQPKNGTLTLSDTGSYTYSAKTNTDATSDSFSFRVSDGTLSSNPATVSITILPSSLQFEIGELKVNGYWQHVLFTNTFSNPVVVAKTATRNEADPGIIRIRNITASGFDIRFQEWEYLDGRHADETVTFLAMEKGTSTIGGATVEAGCMPVSGLKNYQQVTFSKPMKKTPVILTTLTTANEADAVALRLQGANTSGFQIKMQEQENGDTWHSQENACYIAWEPSAGVVNGVMFEAGLTGNTVTNADQVINYHSLFTERPMTLADMQTSNDADPAVAQQKNGTASKLTVQIAEEQSLDKELSHKAENVGYLAIAQVNLSADTDQDKLSNEQEMDIYKTLPTLADSDADGLADGAEVQYWKSVGGDPLADIDNDGLTNINDADSDNDGYLDGAEIAAGYNPASAASHPFSLPMEAGEVDVTHKLARISFTHAFVHPVVVANMVTRNGGDPSVVRISDVDKTGFSVRVQEYDYLDGWHTKETISYMVLEKGAYTLANGAVVEAGTFNTSATSPEHHVYQHAMQTKPVILASIATANESDAVESRVNNITTTGFQYMMQEQEKNPQVHGLETVDYIAWEPGNGSFNGVSYDVGTSSNNITNNSVKVPYAASFQEKPILLAGMQTTNDSDTSSLRISKSDASGMTAFVEEERSKDTEISHGPETDGYVAVILD